MHCTTKTSKLLISVVKEVLKSLAVPKLVKSSIMETGLEAAIRLFRPTLNIAGAVPDHGEQAQQVLNCI